MVKTVQETQETWVQSLGQEDPLKQEMATHCRIFAWRIPWAEDSVHGVTKIWTQVSTHVHTHDAGFFLVKDIAYFQQNTKIQCILES